MFTDVNEQLAVHWKARLSLSELARFFSALAMVCHFSEHPGYLRTGATGLQYFKEWRE